MKTLLLFMTSLLLSITTVSAADIKPKKKEVHQELTKQYRFVQPIVFVERGIEFSYSLTAVLILRFNAICTITTQIQEEQLLTLFMPQEVYT